MAVGVARSRDDGDGIVEELLAVLGDDELILKDIEVATDGLHHVRQRLLIALGLGKVGIWSAPEIILFLQKVDLGVREGGLAVVDEAIQVVGMRMAEEAHRDLLRLDAELTKAFGQPAEIRVRVTLAETGVDQRDLVADLQAHDIDVQRQRVQALAIEDKGVLHRGAVRLRPHQLEALLEEHMAVTDREGLDLTDVELVDVGVGRALHRRLGRIGGGEP